MTMRTFFTTDADFDSALMTLLTVEQSTQNNVRERVASIITDIRQRGDEALLHYAAILDNTTANHVSELRVPGEVLKAAWESLDEITRHALKIAHDNIAEYGQYQKLQGFSYIRPDGSILAQQVTPVDSAGIYVPGGKAAYPSSVMMNAIPAKVAGVPRVVMVVPTPGGMPSPLVLATAYLCQVDEVWQIGGAHAIAALAYGTETILPVDKITGPGNAYVAEAKRAVFGQVGIDMIAGPSEVAIIADDSANPEWIVADMFAQAEHDEIAQSILITASHTVAKQVSLKIEEMLSKQPRAEIIRASISNRGAIIVCQDIKECIAVANKIAPEHLEIITEKAENLVPYIRHAGAIFVGEHSNEVFGDYCAGTNHVLPTSRTARFASALGVYDFQKRSSVLQLSHEAATQLSPIAEHLAQGEGLYAHALSAHLRGNHS